ncbi:hypothetical protein E1293_01335 [Actinomadura darangshiensis]|uniref:Uncharacterized protein n=1 Tax=Actinomadura darangshiensis TaxID=705336 RepID=A0A4R5C5N4_9ACTN|nr:hypothetical protein [Actinomadura darangshiensis]TDD92182.1 hypothetical protein E1293_01335 [Actinomadura darangshiensis]
MEPEAGEAVGQREMAAARVQETQRLEHERELAELRARNESQLFGTEAAEKLRRTRREHDDTREVAELQTETTRHEQPLFGTERRRSCATSVNGQGYRLGFLSHRPSHATAPGVAIASEGRFELART